MNKNVLLLLVFVCMFVIGSVRTAHSDGRNGAADRGAGHYQVAAAEDYPENMPQRGVVGPSDDYPARGAVRPDDDYPPPPPPPPGAVGPAPEHHRGWHAAPDDDYPPPPPPPPPGAVGPAW